FSIQAQYLHRDTNLFSVSGDYATEEEGDPVPVAITYGYSRDHREDLKQWMLALVTTHDGDIPLFLRPLDGNSSDKEHLSAAVKEVMTQLREQLPEEQEERIAIFDSGGYSEANMKSYNDARIWWISRVPETSSTAKTALEEEHEDWKQALKGKPSWLMATFTLKEQAQYQQRGRPKKEATPEQMVWYLVPKLEVDQQAVTTLARKKAGFIVATNILDEQRLAHEH